MFFVRTNVVNENGVMRAAVRNALRAEIDKVQVIIEGQVIELEDKGGEWFAPIAVGEDGKVVNAKVNLTLTIADYVPTKKVGGKITEKIVIEKAEDVPQGE